MLTMAIDTAKFSKLQEKFQKYGPYAITQGLKHTTEYLNTPSFKAQIYPVNRNGSAFVWSSDRQRRFVFANVELPYQRTMGLADGGEFKVNERWFTIEYTNIVPWWKYVLHPSYQIIGHKTRGWRTINQYVVKEAPKIVKEFKQVALDAWEEMDRFITGAGGGL